MAMKRIWKIFLYHFQRGDISVRTAVANNDQIVEGIKRGVYESVMAAMSQQGNKGGGGTAVLNVNGSEFA